MYLSSEYNIIFCCKNNEEGFLEKALEYGYDLDLHYALVTEELLDICHKNGLKVNTWTVDDTEIAKKLIDMGIDYITTNICE